jgi:hypothetical protein
VSAVTTEKESVPALLWRLWRLDRMMVVAQNIFSSLFFYSISTRDGCISWASASLAMAHWRREAAAGTSLIYDRWHARAR